MSRRAKYGPQVSLRTLKPLMNAECTSATAIAAIARRPSNAGKRVARFASTGAGVLSSIAGSWRGCGERFGRRLGSREVDVGRPRVRTDRVDERRDRACGEHAQHRLGGGAVTVGRER